MQVSGGRRSRRSRLDLHSVIDVCGDALSEIGRTRCAVTAACAFQPTATSFVG